MLSYPQWNKQGALRTALWNWVKHLRNVSDNDESPPYVHRLINRCYQAGRLKHVITFNIDGLEFKEGRLHERKIHSTSTGPFLQQMEVRNGFPSVLQMHGDISHGRCRICRHIQPLTINQIDELSLGGLVYCDFCKQKDKNTPIHPNITLYDDPFDTGIPVEHQEVFHEAIGICGKRPPGIVIVIGLSLSKARVLPWLTAASKQRKFIIVNTKYETAFKKFDPSSQVIVSDAQEWASEMMKSFSIINPTDKCGSSNRKRSKVSND
ncbi:DHS-like NAD/FAD-binding domain-containing protein [Serendipita vermifera]|nr:DHS-like NAD/FAD-binding domain-containing protein [Serendipita vermifera]